MVEGLVNSEPLNSEPPPKLRALRTVGSNKQCTFMHSKWRSCNDGLSISHIANHTSQITNHTNHKSQKSPNTKHKSPITNHQSHIENHQSQSTNHTNHIRKCIHAGSQFDSLISKSEFVSISEIESCMYHCMFREMFVFVYSFPSPHSSPTLFQDPHFSTSGHGQTQKPTFLSLLLLST